MLKLSPQPRVLISSVPPGIGTPNSFWPRVLPGATDRRPSWHGGLCSWRRPATTPNTVLAERTHRCGCTNSLFRQMKSLFAKQTSLFRLGRELACNALELQVELTSRTGELAKKLRIPCYFPCYQGIQRIKADPASASQAHTRLATNRTAMVARNSPKTISRRRRGVLWASRAPKPAT